MESIIHGVLLAFGLILPLGVQNVFIFTQGATQPTLMRGLPAAFTAALCDTLLIIVSVFGLSLMMAPLTTLRSFLMVAGVLFLLYMGWSIWRAAPSVMRDGHALSIKKQIIFACSVSLLNPHALLDIVGVIGTSALKYDGVQLVLFTASCIAVSWIWFFGLLVVGSRIQQLPNQTRVMNVFNKSSALFIWAMALYLASSLF